MATRATRLRKSHARPLSNRTASVHPPHPQPPQLCFFTGCSHGGNALRHLGSSIIGLQFRARAWLKHHRQEILVFYSLPMMPPGHHRPRAKHRRPSLDLEFGSRVSDRALVGRSARAAA